jgi:hypothetical protein
MRPAFPDETWLPSLFIQSLFDVCSETENRATENRATENRQVKIYVS